MCIPSFLYLCFVMVWMLARIPDFGRFLPLTRLAGCAWPHGHARPKTSLIAHAKTSTPTDGLDELEREREHSLAKYEF